MKSRIVPDGWFAIMLLLSFILHFTVPVSMVIPHAYNLAGIALVVAGFALTLAANRLMIMSRTTNQPESTPNLLLTSGPFRVSRNPVYLGMAIIMLGVEILLGSLSGLIVPVIFVIIIDRLFIRPEESLLESLFGDRYLEYKKRVRRWM